MKVCTLCNTEKPLADFEPNSKMRDGFLNQCRRCKYLRRVSTEEKRAQKNATQRRWKIKSLYGITENQYDGMLKSQNGVCAICGNEDRHGKLLAVDHDHSTGAVRRLLCGDCNIMLGGAMDNPETLRRGIECLLSFQVGGEQ